MAGLLNIGQLKSRMGALLRRVPQDQNESQSEIVENGDFRLNLRSRKATVRGQDVRLTWEEFDLLVFLIGHPRRVVTSRTILSTRGGHHEVRQTQFLRVLATLRQKLETAAGQKDYIRTEPWIVYRFNPGA